VEQLLAQGSSPIRRYPNPDSDRGDHMGSTRDVYGTGDMGTRSIELGHGHGIGRGGGYDTFMFLDIIFRMEANSRRKDSTCPSQEGGEDVVS